MTKGKGTKGQTTNYKNLKIEQHEPYKNPGKKSVVPEGWTLPVPTSDNLRVTVVTNPVIGQNLYQIRSDRSEAQIIERKKLGVNKPKEAK